MVRLAAITRRRPARTLLAGLACLTSAAVISAVVVTQTKKSADPNLTLTSAAGAPDQTFNKSGTVALGGTSAATGVAIVPAGAQAGKIMVSAGDGTHFQVARFTAAGPLDTTFGGGLVSSDSLLGQAQAVAVTAAGVVVAAGYVTSVQSSPSPTLCPAPFPTPAVVEYLATGVSAGSLNPAFGTGGVATIPCPTPGGPTPGGPTQGGRFNGVTVDSAGNVYAAGEGYGTANTPSTLVAAFSSSGLTSWSTSDPPVGSTSLENAVGATQSVANAVALSPNGDVITAGSSVVGGTQKLTVAAFKETGNGSLDWATASGASGIASGVTVLPNTSPVPTAQQGNIVAVGTNGSNFLLAQFNPKGSLDTSFGTGGLVVNSPNLNGIDALRAVSYQPQDHILSAAGSVTSGQNTNLVVAQYNAKTGAPNTSFGPSGVSKNGAVVESFPFNSSMSAVTMDSSGRTLAAGSLPFVNGVSQLGVLRVYGPVVFVPNRPAATAVRAATSFTVTLPVSIDEPVFGPVTAAVCATPASTVIKLVSPPPPLKTALNCTTVTIPSGSTTANVIVTVRIVVPPGRSQTLALTASSSSGAFVSLTQKTGTIVINHHV
jgi:uncharacterized delta-60 repeat protein